MGLGSLESGGNVAEEDNDISNNAKRCFRFAFTLLSRLLCWSTLLKWGINPLQIHRERESSVEEKHLEIIQPRIYLARVAIFQLD